MRAFETEISNKDSIIEGSELLHQPSPNAVVLPVTVSQELGGSSYTLQLHHRPVHCLLFPAYQGTVPDNSSSSSEACAKLLQHPGMDSSNCSQHAVSFVYPTLCREPRWQHCSTIIALSSIRSGLFLIMYLLSHVRSKSTQQVFSGSFSTKYNGRDHEYPAYDPRTPHQRAKTDGHSAFCARIRYGRIEEPGNPA